MQLAQAEAKQYVDAVQAGTPGNPLLTPRNGQPQQVPGVQLQEPALTPRAARPDQFAAIQACRERPAADKPEYGDAVDALRGQASSKRPTKF